MPAALALNMGAAAPIAFLACALAMGAVVLCCAEAGSRVPTSGGMYGYIEAALGPLAGFVAGFMGVWLSSALACGGIAAAFAAVLGAGVPALSGPLAHAAIIVLAIAGLSAVNLAGARTTSRFIAVGTAVKLVPLLVFLVVGIWFVRADALAASAAVTSGGFGRAVILALFAFSGMETTLSASGEVDRPERNIPRALFGAMLFVLVLYTGIQLVAQGLLGAALAGSAAPLADAIGTVSPALRLLLLAASAGSMLFWIASDVFGAPRVLFAFARDRLLPAVLGRVSATRGVPVPAVATHAAVAIAFGVSGTFESLAVLSALTTTVLYALACAAAWRLHARDVAFAGPPIRFRILPVAAVVGIVAMIAIVAQASRAEILGTAATTLGSAILYWIARAVGSRRAKGSGARPRA